MAELSIEEFLDLELPEFCPVTTRLQKMLAEAGGAVDEAVAEILATMVYNLEVSLVNTRIALMKLRTGCQHLTAHSANLEARLIEAAVLTPADPQETNTLFDAMREAAAEPLP